MKSRTLSIVGLVTGGIFALSPIWTVCLTTLFMAKSFHNLGKSGIANPTQLSTEIGNTLMVSFIGLLTCPFGILIFIVSLIFFVLSFSSTQPPPLPSESSKTA